jgi:hypothetical protein
LRQSRKIVANAKERGGIEQSQNMFKNLNINITVEGKRHIGAALGSDSLDAFKEAYFEENIQSWCSELNVSFNIPQTQPHAAYAGYIHGFKHKLTYFLRTIPNTSALLQTIEGITTHQFLPTLFGLKISTKDRRLFSPHTLGGLGINKLPVQDEDFSYYPSKSTSSPQASLIVSQQHTLPDGEYVDQL